MTHRHTLDKDWSVWLDGTTQWRDLPLDRLDKLPRHPPSGGWNVLDGGVPIDLPATTLDVDPEHRGVSWWSREIDVSAEGPLVLRFGGVRLLCEVFWDRKRVAVDLEGYTPFEARIPAVKPGRHRLDLRVTNPGGMHSWDDVRPVEWGRFLLPSSHEFGGPWQSVSIHEAAWSRIADVWVRPSRRLDAALVDVEVEAAAPETLHVEVQDPSGSTVAAHTVTAAPGVTQLSLDVPDPHLYAPGAPHLYLCRVTLGEEQDLVERRFGFRLLDYADGDLRLNGEPFRVATAISWGRYRRGPVPSPGDVDREAESLLTYGMNTFTAHRFPSTPQLQDALEQRGLMLYQEPGGVGGPQFVPPIPPDQRPFVMELMTRRLRRLARRDRSRACLAWWNVANEWSNDHMDSWPDYVRALPRALRAEDDSRLTTFTSGWGITPMWRPHDSATYRAWDYHRVFTWPDAWTDAVEWEVEVARPPEPMLAIDGESACFTSISRLREIDASLPTDAPPGSPAWHWRQWVENLEADLAVADPEGRLGGLDGLGAATAAVQAHSFARLIQAHRRQGWLHGLTLNGWHQHHKVTTSGIVAPDRSPVCDPEPLKRANAPESLAFTRLPRVMQRGAAHEVAVERIGLHGTEGEVSAELTLDRDGRTVATVETPDRVTPEDTGLLDVEARQGELRVADRVLVIDPPSVDGLELALADPYGELTDWLERAGVRTRRWRFHEPGPVLAVSERGAAIHEYLHKVPAGRVAILADRKPFGYVPVNFEGPGFEGMPAAPGGTVPMHGAYIGGWAFSSSDAELPNLGPPGVWGAERGALFASQGVLQPPGRWVTGFCSFPDADNVDIRMPRLAATTWVIERESGHDVLYTHLPLVERRDHPLGRAVLLDLVRWLAANR